MERKLQFYIDLDYYSFYFCSILSITMIQGHSGIIYFLLCLLSTFIYMFLYNLLRYLIKRFKK